MIRRWKPPDAADCLMVFRAAVLAGRGYTLVQRSAWSRIPYSFLSWRLRQQRNLTLVAEARGRIAGFTECRPDGHVHMLFVHPDFQGEGIAGALLAAADREMTSRGVSRRDAWASRNAFRVFEKAGYVRMGAALKPTAGEHLLCWRMALRRSLR